MFNLSISVDWIMSKFSYVYDVYTTVQPSMMKPRCTFLFSGYRHLQYNQSQIIVNELQFHSAKNKKI